MPHITAATAKRVLGFYWHAARIYPKNIWTILILTPLAVITNNLLPPLILARVLQRLSTHDYTSTDPWRSFAPELLLYAALVLLSGLVLWRIMDISAFRLEGKVQRDLAQHVYRHLIIQSSDFHANNFSGALVSQNNKLLGGYIRVADTTMFIVIPLIVSVLAAAVILVGRAPLFAGCLVLFAATYVVVAFKVSQPTRRAAAIHAATESKQTGYLADSITNAMAIKSFAMEEYEEEAFAKAAETTHQELRNFMRIHQRQMFYFTGMSGLIQAGSLALAVTSVLLFDSNIATVFLIFNYTASIISQLFTFSNQALRNYNRAIGDASDMVKILDTAPEVVDPKHPEEARMHRGAISFKNVSFKHKGADEAIFKGLNVRIKPGEKVGLVGHSGSGKTTLTRVLLRFSDITEGAVEIDGQNIASVTQNDLRRAIAYVPQEPLLFHRTIAENIGYSDHKASERQIRAVAKKANAAAFIEVLPDGYETLVGERGIKLSGGQRQRIAIARAMLKNAPILVLDEATSALDSESEGLIQDALWKLMEGRTAIVIAHRLSTIQRMDRILVMQDGRVVEEGSHKDLLYAKGVYARLWQRQSGGFIEE